MIGMARDYAQQSMASFMKDQKRTMSCKRSLSRSGRKQGVIHPRLASRSDGMVTIARRRAIDRLRRRQAYSRVRERYQERVVQQSPNSPREADDVFVLNDLRHFLKQCMRVLPRLQREALELAFFKGLSHREIAIATRAPLGTVKTRLELGLQKLTHAVRPLRQKV
jgi:predicted RNA polymerase sigma factor